MLSLRLKRLSAAASALRIARASAKKTRRLSALN